MTFDQHTPWQDVLKYAVQQYVEQNVGDLEQEHIAATPMRTVTAWAEYISGTWEKPEDILTTSFEDSTGYDEMIQISDIPVISTCAHHCAPIIGKAHFAYIPSRHDKSRVVGLSKIPRFIDVLARRLQVQERLTDQIVDVFSNCVRCEGVAVEIVALHCCMMLRGVRVHPTPTHTMAVTGAFKTHAITRQEFLARPQHLKL